MKNSIKTWLISAFLIASMPEILFAPNYGKAMKMYQSSRNIGREILNLVLILGGLALAVALIVYAKRWWDQRSNSSGFGRGSGGVGSDWDFDDQEED